MRTALITLAVLAGSLFAQEGRNAAEYNLQEGRLGLKGYDPVAYFDVGGSRPTVGEASITHEHQGVVYRFASEEHREVFRGDPERYEPAYGGWCAFAMAKDLAIDIDPLAWRLAEGRLVLFVDRDYVAFDGDWVPEEHELLQDADRNWKARSGESPRTRPRAEYRLTTEWNLSGDALAIEGYDPVAYFPEGGGAPTRGKQDLAYRHEGVTYRFASEANRKRFLADPEKYEPRHGGWCSFAMAQGEKVEIDPEAFRLTDDRLHLFYTGWFTDTREDWDEDTASLKRDADREWAGLLEGADPTS